MKVRALLAAGALVVAAPTAALAVWGGEPDGDDHPSVGAFFFDVDESGTINGDDLILLGLLRRDPLRPRRLPHRRSSCRPKAISTT